MRLNRFIKGYFGICLSIFFVLLSVPLMGQDIPAFPGAEGFGKYAKGGRGGEVIKVTNLKDSGSGSLRSALEAEGPRIVLFEIAGLIDLKTPIEITNPYITIAGQTAPGDGIALRGNGIRILTHDVIMRFIRIRPGDVSFGPENKWGGLEALLIGKNGVDEGVHDIIVDHCSFSWGVDENVDIWNEGYNITIQNSFITEALNDSKHPKGSHSKGLVAGKKIDSLSILNNFFAHNTARNPKTANRGLVDVRQNIVYNPGSFAVKISNGTVRKEQKLNLVKNKFVRGPSTRFDYEISIWKPEKYNGKIYLEGNIGFNGEEDDWLMMESWQPEMRTRLQEHEDIESEVEFSNKVSKEKNHEEIRDYIDNYGGASLPKRDAVDKRIIEEFMKKEGKIINSQNEVGGWPVYKDAPILVDSNNDGIPDTWAEKFNIVDGGANMDYDNDGYTNIEEYINGTDPNAGGDKAEDIFDSFHNGFETSSLKINLQQNYPNPFNSSTTIRFELEQKQKIYLKVYDVLGRTVAHLVESTLVPGSYEIIWETHNLASGMYIISMQTSKHRLERKMTLVK